MAPKVMKIRSLTNDEEEDLDFEPAAEPSRKAKGKGKEAEAETEDATTESADELRIWTPSSITDEQVQAYYKSRRIPQGVAYRIPPKGQVFPEPLPDENVIFGSHLDRGLGLPASPFFHQFLIEYGVLPHHLPPNTISILSALVSFSEAYLGLLPTVELFATFFYLGPQKIPKPGVLP